MQTEDEIYYVVSGHGMMTADGKTFEVGPGTAVLIGLAVHRPEAGAEDLVIIINYEQKKP